MEPPDTRWYGKAGNLGWASKSTSAITKSVRRGVHCSRQGAGNGLEKTDDPGKGRDIHRRPGRHQANTLGGAWTGPDVRAPGKKAHRSAVERLTGHTSRSGGVRYTRVSRETRRPTSGQARGGRARRPRDGMARMRGRRTGQGHARCRCPDPSCASSERSPRGVGGTPLMGWRGRAPRKKYKMPSRQKLDRVVAGSSKRLVSRFY